MESQIFNCNFIRKLRSLAAKTAGLKTRKNIKSNLFNLIIDNFFNLIKLSFLKLRSYKSQCQYIQ